MRGYKLVRHDYEIDFQDDRGKVNTAFYYGFISEEHVREYSADNIEPHRIVQIRKVRTHA